ncbi:hypothetical protein H4Q26_007650 [Puccinia striiformis f. sp. tritici PST-130]|nr:hypothetical protein H4Q26_007650 [Puccinia striiformis f. sp. tritici PST-130]
MPTATPPPSPPHSSIHAPGSQMNGNETRRNASNIGQPDADHDMDGLLESQPSNGHPLPAICQKIDLAPIKLLKKLMAHRGPSGKIELDEEMTDMLMFLMESEADQKQQLQSVIEEMKHLRQRIQTIEAEQRQTLRNQLKAPKLKGNDLTARYLLRNPKAAIPLANFIRNSRRFASYPSYTTKFGPK